MVDLGRGGGGGGGLDCRLGPDQPPSSWSHQILDLQFFFVAKCIETEIATTDLELIAYHSTTFNFSRSQSLVIVRS